MRKIVQIFEAFSEKLNFNNHQISKSFGRMWELTNICLVKIILYARSLIVFFLDPEPAKLNLPINWGTINGQKDTKMAIVITKKQTGSNQDFKFRCFWEKDQVFLFHQDSVIFSNRTNSKQEKVRMPCLPTSW